MVWSVTDSYIPLHSESQMSGFWHLLLNPPALLMIRHNAMVLENVISPELSKHKWLPCAVLTWPLVQVGFLPVSLSFLSWTPTRVPPLGPHFLFLAFPTGPSPTTVTWGESEAFNHGFFWWVYIAQSIVPLFSWDDSLGKIRNHFLGAAFLSLHFRRHQHPRSHPLAHLTVSTDLESPCPQ